MTSESISFVVHEDQVWKEPRREFGSLEEAQVWHREMCPTWEITRVTRRIAPAAMEVAA